MAKTLTVPPQVMDQYHERITRSMAFLDDYLGGPEWIDMIDLEDLDLEDASQCVCGQLFDEMTGLRTVDDMRAGDGYAYALKHVVEHGVPDDYLDTDLAQQLRGIHAAEYLGFTISDEPVEEAIAKHNGYPTIDAMWQDDDLDISDIPHPWVLLTQTWHDRIEKRRAELGSMA